MYPYHREGLELVQLDRAVWDVRRYCIPVDPRLSPKGTPAADLDLRRIEDAINHPPQKFRPVSTGVLEEIVKDLKNTARPALIWNNLYFGPSLRKSVKLKQTRSSFNSPLSLYPEIIEEVRNYVYLPPGVEVLKRP
jgi:hypothetical protein